MPPTGQIVAERIGRNKLQIGGNLSRRDAFFPGKELIEQLEYEGYTHEQAVYASQSKRLLCNQRSGKYAGPSFCACSLRLQPF